MSYKIVFKRPVSRDLKKIDKKQADIILKKIEKHLPERADNSPALTGKFAGLRKFQIGNYRVIFTILEDTVITLRISHR